MSSSGPTFRRAESPGLTGISVQGYKSLIDRVEVELRPFTVLAGANSSGKSSVIQPLLLLKQTLEASYDPGPLRIDGPNVEFTAVEQFFSRVGKKRSATATELVIGLESEGQKVETTFKRPSKGGALQVTQMSGSVDGIPYTLRPGMVDNEVADQLPEDVRDIYDTFAQRGDYRFVVQRNRAFLSPAIVRVEEGKSGLTITGPAFNPTELTEDFDRLIRALIHIPGLRGNPERLYPVTAVGPVFPGQFQTYVASIMAQWQATGADDRIQAVGDDLLRLGLTWRVRAVPVSDTQVEIQVGRLPHAAQGGAWDLVSIADVGFGVSQVLPILVALRAARRGQVIYIEQPEIHLHPKAQVELARIVGEAVRRGVRVVVETHSDLFLVAVQTLVANEELGSDAVKLHWFSRRATGETDVASADLDEAGTFGNWPEDFAEVQLEAKDAYLSAAEPKLRLFDDVA
jgi:hypothetical protein